MMDGSRDLQLLICGLLFAIIIPFFSKVPKALLIPLLYFTVHAAWFAFNRDAFDQDINPITRLSMHINALEVFVMLICFPLFISRLPILMKAFVLGGIYCMMLFDSALFAFGRGGVLFTWPTFECAMMACFIPVVFRVRWKLAVPLLIPIIGLHALTAATCALVGMSTYLKKRWAVIFIPVILTVLFIIKPFFTLALSERWEMWTQYFNWFSMIPHAWLTGVGPGSFEELGPLFRSATAHQYVLMHNDYLQILFETGVPGLLMFLWVCGYLLWATRLKLVYFSSLVAVMLCMLTYFPLHFFTSQLMLLFLIDESLYNDPIID
jgi:hypothetical protein